MLSLSTGTHCYGYHCERKENSPALSKRNDWAKLHDKNLKPEERKRLAMTSRLYYSVCGVSPRVPCGVSPRVSMRVNKPRAKQTVATVRRSLSLGREMTSDFLTLACYNAIATGQLGLLKAIYKTGKAPQVDKQGNTPLHVAAKCGQLRSLRWLLVHSNTPLLAKNSRGETCAHVASLQGQLKCLQAIVLSKMEKASLIACERDNMGMTVLHHATIGNRDVVVTWLLQEFGKDICLVKSCDGVLAIHLAAAAGNKACTELLARGCKASVNMRDVFGATPVFYSAQEGNLNCLHYLSEHADGSLDMIAFEGMTSFLSAAEGGHLDVVKYILEKQGHEAMLSTTIDGATVFHYVCSVGNAAILKFLLELPDTAELLRVTDAFDRTPAHDAAEQGHVICLKLLMEAGMSLYLPDKDGATPLSLALQSGNPNCVMFAKAVADSTLDKSSMKILKKKLGSKFNQVSNIMMIHALSKDEAQSFKKPRNWLCKKKMGQYESTHELSDILAFKQGVSQPHVWPQWHQTLQSRRPSRNSNRGIFRGEFILMRSSPPGTCRGRNRRLGSPPNGYLYAQRNRPCPISLPLQRHEYPTRIHQIEAEDELDIDDLDRFSQRTPLGMIQEYNGFHDGSRDSSLNDIKEEQEETYEPCSRTLPVIRRPTGRSFLDDRSHYEEAKTVFSTKKLFSGNKKKTKEEKEKLTTVQEDDGTDNRSPSPEVDYSSDESGESGISGIEGQHGFSLSTSGESGHIKRLSCDSSDSAMRDSDGGSSLSSDLEVVVTTAEINILHGEKDDVDKKPADDMSGYESSLPSSRIQADSDETAIFSFADSTEDGSSERGSVKKFPLPERPPWKSKGLSHMQLNSRKFSSSSEEDGGVPFSSFLQFQKENKNTQSSKHQEEEHLYSEIVPLSEQESEVDITHATDAHRRSKHNESRSLTPNVAIVSGSLADILKHSITNGTFQRAGRGIPPAHSTCNPVFSSENIVKDPSTLERRKNATSTKTTSEKVVQREDKKLHERSDSDEGIASHDDSSEQTEFKLDETHDIEPKKRGLKIKELQQILIKKDLPFANPAMIFGFQAKKQEIKEPRKNPVVISQPSRSRSNSCSDSDIEITLKPSSIVRPKRAAAPTPNPTHSVTSAVTSTPYAPPAPPLPPPSTLPKVSRSTTKTSPVRLAARKDEEGIQKSYATTTTLNDKKDDLCFDDETRARISSIKAMLQRATLSEKPMGTMSLPRKIPSVS